MSGLLKVMACTMFACVSICVVWCFEACKFQLGMVTMLAGYVATAYVAGRAK